MKFLIRRLMVQTLLESKLIARILPVFLFKLETRVMSIGWESCFLISEGPEELMHAEYLL